MGKSFILRATGDRSNGACRLERRLHDLGGTDYERIATLTMEEGLGLAKAGILHFMFHQDLPEDTSLARLSVKLRDDPKPDVRLWVMESHVEGQKPRLVGYIPTDAVVDLIDLKVDIDFPDGPPDWDKFGDLLMLLEIEKLRSRAEAIEKELEERISQRSINIEAEPEMEIT